MKQTINNTPTKTYNRFDKKENLPMHAALFLGGGVMKETVVDGNGGVITAYDDAQVGRWLDLENVQKSTDLINSSKLTLKRHQI